MGPMGSASYGCVGFRGTCGLYTRGHNLHWRFARLVGESPWGWRDAIVQKAGANGVVHLRYLVEDAHVITWQHQDLTGLVTAGDLVRLHEEQNVLGGGFGWAHVKVHKGLGPVPAPAEPALWAPEMTAGIVDLTTGLGVPTDHTSTGAPMPGEEPA